MKFISNHSILYLDRLSGYTDYTPIWGGETDNYYRLLDFSGKGFELDHKWADHRMQMTVQALAYTFPFLERAN